MKASWYWFSSSWSWVGWDRSKGRSQARSWSAWPTRSARWSSVASKRPRSSPSWPSSCSSDHVGCSAFDNDQPAASDASRPTTGLAGISVVPHQRAHLGTQPVLDQRRLAGADFRDFRDVARSSPWLRGDAILRPRSLLRGRRVWLRAVGVASQSGPAPSSRHWTGGWCRSGAAGGGRATSTRNLLLDADSCLRPDGLERALQQPTGGSAGRRHRPDRRAAAGLAAP